MGREIIEQEKIDASPSASQRLSEEAHDIKSSKQVLSSGGQNQLAGVEQQQQQQHQQVEIKPLYEMPLTDGSYLLRITTPKIGEAVPNPIKAFEEWMQQKGISEGSFTGLGTVSHITLDTASGKQTFSDPSYEATGVKGHIFATPSDKNSVSLTLGDVNKNAHTGLVKGTFDIPANLEVRFVPKPQGSSDGTAHGGNSGVKGSDITAKEVIPLPDGVMTIDRHKDSSFTIDIHSTKPGVLVQHPLADLKDWIKANHITGGSLTGHGRGGNFNLATWDSAQGKYTDRSFTNSSYELPELNGNVAYTEAKPSQPEDVSFHVHVAINDKQNALHMGHLDGDFAAEELKLEFVPSVNELHRVFSPGTGGLALEPFGGTGIKKN